MLTPRSNLVLGYGVCYGLLEAREQSSKVTACRLLQEVLPPGGRRHVAWSYISTRNIHLVLDG
jgi:hypothetical protein